MMFLPAVDSVPRAMAFGVSFGIASGAYDIALAVGVEQMGAAGLLKPRNQTTPIPREGVLGSGLMPAVLSAGADREGPRQALPHHLLLRGGGAGL